MNYVLDTDICIYILNGGNSNLQNRFRKLSHRSIQVTTLTEAELLYGAIHSSRPEENQERVELFLYPFVKTPFDSKAASEFALIKQDLVKRGKGIAVIDMLIAAIVRANGFTLITNNTKHFASIPRLLHDNWSI